MTMLRVSKSSRGTSAGLTKFPAMHYWSPAKSTEA